MSNVIVLRNVGDLGTVAGISMKIYHDAGDWLDSSDFLDELVKEYTRLGRKTNNTSGGQGIAKMKPALYFGLIESKTENGHNYHRLTRSGISFYNAYCNSDEDQMVDILLHQIPGRCFGQFNDAVPESASEIDPPKVFLTANIIFNGIDKNEYAYLLQELGKGRDMNTILSEVGVSRSLKTKLDLSTYSQNNYRDDKGLLFLCQAGLTEDNTPTSPIKKKYLQQYSNLLARIGVLSIIPSTEKTREEAFKLYLNENTSLQPGTIAHYLTDIKKDLVVDAVKVASNNLYDSIYQVDDSAMATIIRDQVISDPRNNGSGGHGGFPGSACSQYVDFLKMWEYRSSTKSFGGIPLQKVFYGAPGTGKSYKIKHEILPPGTEPFLVTFYSDYYYSDFVGGLRPKKGDNGIEYIFEPGPLAKALKDSFKNGPTYLIIEEINRGNAAAIFGDIFQLLDRKGGQSEYAITNHELYEYLVKEGVQGLEEDKVYLPSTLNILCTMNTADQNVFVLDTAFKRRFKMEYVPINFKAYYETAEDGSEKVKDKCRGYLENVSIFEGQKFEKDLKIVMTDDIYKKVAKTIKEPKRDWPTFASYVNAKIDTINALEQKISEDKKLGPFFVDTDELLDIKAFVDKVIYYLKQDVFKYEDNILMDSYEALYDRFVNNKEDVFELFDHPKQK